MANLAASAVTLNEYWREGGVSGRQFGVKDLTLALTGQGGGTNKILASTLGFSKIVSATAIRKTDNSLMLTGAPSADFTHLLLADVATGAAADVSGSFRMLVTGKD